MLKKKDNSNAKKAKKTLKKALKKRSFFDVDMFETQASRQKTYSKRQTRGERSSESNKKQDKFFSDLDLNIRFL